MAKGSEKYQVLKRLERHTTLVAAAWMAVLAVICLWLGWRIYAGGPEALLQALADGRAMVITLAEPAQPAAGKRAGTLADSSDASTFPAQPPTAAAPPPLSPKPGQSLRTAPDPALSEQIQLGALPKIGSDGTKPWIAYAHPFTRSGSRPVIAILITDIGMNKQEGDAALQLPPEVDLSLSPYAAQPKLWGDAARALGHEIFIGLPLEPANFATDDPGPQALLAMYPADDNLQHLRWALTRTPGIIGVEIAASERLSVNSSSARPVYQFLADHGMMMAVAPGGPSGDQDQLFTQTALPYMRADVRLDDSPTRDDIAHQLATLENAAVRRGYAFGVGHAYPVTLKALSEWAQTLGDKGIILAPVSALARMKFS